MHNQVVWDVTLCLLVNTHVVTFRRIGVKQYKGAECLKRQQQRNDNHEFRKNCIIFYDVVDQVSRSALFRHFTQRRMASCHRRFETTYQSHIQDRTEKSRNVGNKLTLYAAWNPRERRRHSQRDRSVKSRIIPFYCEAHRKMRNKTWTKCRVLSLTTWCSVQ